MWPSRRFVFHVVKEALRNFVRVQGMFLSSGLAFDVLLYFIPMLFLTVSAVGYILAGSTRAASGAEAVLKQLLPNYQESVTDYLNTISTSRDEFGLAGFVLLLIFSTAIFGSIRHVLNIVLNIKITRGFLWGKTIDFVILLVTSALFVAAIGINVVLAFLRGFTDKIPILGVLISPAWWLAGTLADYCMTIILFYVLYRFCPAQKLERRALWTATLSCAILFELSKWIFTWYLSAARTYVLIYGAFSVTILFILWIYYSSVVFIFSASVASVLDQGRRVGDPDRFGS